MCEETTLKRIIQKVRDFPEEDATEVLDFVEFLEIKRRRGQDETAYLMREPANARDLLEAVRELREGRGYQVRELLPDD